MAMVDTIAPIEAARPAEIFDACFLRSETISAYLDHIAAAGTKSDPRFRLFDWPVQWSGDKGPFPLALCEFLAYKTALAYSDGATIAAHLHECGIDVTDTGSFEYFDSRTHRRGDTQGYGFVVGDTAFIVMRGTASLKDWADDFMAIPTTASWPLVRKSTLQLIGEQKPRRHLGFARAWGNVAPQIYAWLDALPGKGFNVKHTCLSGHSLGGALAVIGAYELTRPEKKIGPPVAAVVTFAAPTVGGKGFRQQYEEDLKLGPRTLRLEFDRGRGAEAPRLRSGWPTMADRQTPHDRRLGQVLGRSARPGGMGEQGPFHHANWIGLLQRRKHNYSQFSRRRRRPEDVRPGHA